MHERINGRNEWSDKSSWDRTLDYGKVEKPEKLKIQENANVACMQEKKKG